MAAGGGLQSSLVVGVASHCPRVFIGWHVHRQRELEALSEQRNQRNEELLTSLDRALTRGDKWIGRALQSSGYSRDTLADYAVCGRARDGSAAS